MKQLKLICFISTLLLTSACDKEELSDPPGNLVDSPVHCINGIFDSQEGEVSVDCGGPCNPCEFLTTDCETIEDSAYFLYDIGEVDYYLEFTNTSHSVNSVNDQTEILIETAGQDYIILKFEQGQLLPNSEYTFDIYPSSTDDEISMEAYVKDNLTFQTYVDFVASSGTIVVNLIGDKYVIEFCDVSLSNYYNGATYSLGKGEVKVDYFE